MSKCADLVRTEMAEDAVITLTRDEYANCIENFEEGAYNEAVRELWEHVKAEVEAYWKRWNKANSFDCNCQCKQLSTLAGSKLDAYKVAFEVMGYHLSYVIDWFDGKIYSVSCEVGYIRYDA